MREEVWLQMTAKGSSQGVGGKFQVLPPGLPTFLWWVLAPSLLPPCSSPLHFLPLPTFPCFFKAGGLTTESKQLCFKQNTSKSSPLET